MSIMLRLVKGEGGGVVVWGAKCPDTLHCGEHIKTLQHVQAMD